MSINPSLPAQRSCPSPAPQEALKSPVSPDTLISSHADSFNDSLNGGGRPGGRSPVRSATVKGPIAALLAERRHRGIPAAIGLVHDSEANHDHDHDGDGDEDVILSNKKDTCFSGSEGKQREVLSMPEVVTPHAHGNISGPNRTALGGGGGGGGLSDTTDLAATIRRRHSSTNDGDGNSATSLRLVADLGTSEGTRPLVKLVATHTPIAPITTLEGLIAWRQSQRSPALPPANDASIANDNSDDHDDDDDDDDDDITGRRSDEEDGGEEDAGFDSRGAVSTETRSTGFVSNDSLRPLFRSVSRGAARAASQAAATPECDASLDSRFISRTDKELGRRSSSRRIEFLSQDRLSNSNSSGGGGCCLAPASICSLGASWKQATILSAPTTLLGGSRGDPSLISPSNGTVVSEVATPGMPPLRSRTTTYPAGGGGSNNSSRSTISEGSSSSSAGAGRHQVLLMPRGQTTADGSSSSSSSVTTRLSGNSGASPLPDNNTTSNLRPNSSLAASSAYASSSAGSSGGCGGGFGRAHTNDFAPLPIQQQRRRANSTGTTASSNSNHWTISSRQPLSPAQGQGSGGNTRTVADKSNGDNSDAGYGGGGGGGGGAGWNEGAYPIYKFPGFLLHELLAVIADPDEDLTARLSAVVFVALSIATAAYLWLG